VRSSTKRAMSAGCIWSRVARKSPRFPVSTIAFKSASGVIDGFPASWVSGRMGPARAYARCPGVGCRPSMHVLDLGLGKQGRKDGGLEGGSGC